jgi:glycosyltransferase involved in cell wall biosynthesis
MKAEEYIRQQLDAGCKIHFHNNIWWQEAAPFFCKPVLPLQRIVRGLARPKIRKSFLGYSHLIDDDNQANKHWSVMLLDNEKLEKFSLSSLSSSKRAQVRKGLRLNEIKKIEVIDPVIDYMRDICISAASRTGHGKPPQYYIKHYMKWRDFMLKEFAMQKREWWGAFHNGVLIAYYYAYQIDETMFISAAKSHSDYLKDCPNDVLLFTFLEYCRDLPGCTQVIYGDWSNDAPSLNKFKEKYGFQKVDLPVYARYNPAVSFVRGILRSEMSELHKIVVLSTGHSPLDDRIFYKEVLSLTKRYNDIVFVMPGEKADFEEREGIKFVPLRKAGSLLSRFLLVPQAIMAVLKLRPDICHFHDFELIFALPFLRLFTRCKIIYDVHEVYPEMILDSNKIPGHLRPFISWAVDVCEKILARLAHRIITTDDSIKERLLNVHNKVTTIFNYPRLSLFVPDADRVSQIRMRYKDRMPIIYVGSMDETKGGLFRMIKALEIMKDKRPDLILLLVGDMSDKDRERAGREIKQKVLQDYIDIVGPVPHEDVVNYISIAKVGLIINLPTPKWFKNIPIKQFEYMACGVPVVGADLPPIASYVNAAGCGRVIDPMDAEALAVVILDILGDENEWRRMSEAGKRAVQNEWNWDEMEKRLFSVYEELLGKY